MKNSLKKIICFVLSAFMLLGNWNPLYVKAAERLEMVEETVKGEEAIKSSNVENFRIGVPKKVNAKEILCTTSTQYQFLDCNKKGCKIEVSVPGLQAGQVVTVSLYHTSGVDMSKAVKIKKVGQKAFFYLEKTSTFYFLKYSVNSGTVRLQENISFVTPVAGNSFSKAVSVASGSKKKDILGFNSASSKKHYYKINVPKEKLVKINFTKEESSSSQDTMYIKIVKSTKTSKIVTDGYLHEGQKSGYIYIRNSENYRTKPGTYYIIVNKPNASSGFQYSVAY